MSSIKSKLYELNKNQTGFSPPKEKIQHNENFHVIDAVLYSNKFGEYLVREKKFPVSYNHGVPLADFFTVNPKEIAIASRDMSYTEMDSNCIFIDTETTGLAGGTGTYVFLVGVGFFQDNSFLVRQFLLKSPADEQAFVEALAEFFKDKNTFISFNGKSYDIPLLKTRFVLNKTDIFETQHHLDLLFISRRLWRKSIGSCSLSNLEQAVLGFKRENDIPGHEIPEIYFNFLKTNDYLPLKSVLQHNVIDILSMVSLTTVICRFISMENQDLDKVDVLNLMKLFHELKLNKDISTASAKIPKDHDDIIPLLLLKAKSYKQNMKYDLAEQIWLEIIENHARFEPEPYIELAKYYEHKIRAYDKALDIIDRILKRIDILFELRPNYIIKEHRKELLHRKQRVLAKQEKVKMENNIDT